MVAIKGIDMPETCCDCPCIDKISTPNGALYCRAGRGYIKEEQALYERADGCPLLQVDGLINYGYKEKV